MKDSEKNRDPERARKRAKADARCALRKLGLLGRIEYWARGHRTREDALDHAHHILEDLVKALDVEVTP